MYDGGVPFADESDVHQQHQHQYQHHHHHRMHHQHYHRSHHHRRQLLWQVRCSDSCNVSGPHTYDNASAFFQQGKCLSGIGCVYQISSTPLSNQHTSTRRYSGITGKRRRSTSNHTKQIGNVTDSVCTKAAMYRNVGRHHDPHRQQHQPSDHFIDEQKQTGTR